MSPTATHTRSTVRKAVRQALYICIAATVLGLLVNALRPESLLLIRSDETPGPAVEPGGPDGLQTIEPAAALGELQKGNAIFIDARSEYDYRAGHIPTARNLEEKNLDAWMPAFFQQVPPDTRLVFYCSGPRCHLAERLARRLSEFGYTATHVLTAGWNAWLASGYPTESNSTVTAGQSREQATDCGDGECSDVQASSEEPVQSK